MAKKANGEGSVYYEADRKQYKALITDTEGKRITKRFKTKLEATNWLAEIKTEILKNVYVPKSDITVGDWVIEYISTYCTGLRPNTIKRYFESAQHIAPIADILMQKITAPTVQKFYNGLEMSASSKIKVHRLLKSSFKKAEQLGMLSKNIMLAVVAPKAEAKEVEVFTELEVKQIFTSIKDSQYYSKYYPLVYTAISTGARLGELLGLKFSAIKDKHIIINNNLQHIKSVPTDFPPKTKAGNRKITISKDLERLLRTVAYEGTLSIKGYVFRTSVGTPYRADNINKIWKAILKEANIPYKTFHTLRHTHATQLLANNVPLLEVSKRLGHSKPSTTLNLYGHAIKGFDEQIPDKVTAIFGSL
jgi:integrase